MKKLTSYLIALCALIYACNPAPSHSELKKQDTHSRGTATVLIEESFRKLFDTSINTFESQRPFADIVPKYMAESDIIQAFYDNQAKTMVISRELTKKELNYLKSKQVSVRSDKIAVDGIAIILNPANGDTLMTVNHLKALLTGKIGWKNSKEKLIIVYDNQNSANYNFLKAFCGNVSLTKNAIAMKSNEEVINYVKKTPGALGVIGMNWISDDDDFNTLNFLNGINVVSLATKEGGPYYEPIASYIYTEDYPLSRDIWMINKGKRSGLNSGFVNYMVGEDGQLLVQKSDLVPAKAPIRLIELREE